MIVTFATFSIFSGIDLIRSSLQLSKYLNKATRNEHNYVTRVKALLLPKRWWINDVEGAYVQNLVNANACSARYLKRLFISIIIYGVALLLIIIPNLYQVYILENT